MSKLSDAPEQRAQLGQKFSNLAQRAASFSLGDIQAAFHRTDCPEEAVSILENDELGMTGAADNNIEVLEIQDKIYGGTATQADLIRLKRLTGSNVTIRDI